jgi:hypothetical protein
MHIKVMQRRLALAIGLFSAFPAFATERRLTWSYESLVLNPGAKELELWTTPRIGREDFYVRLDHRIELEFGVLDRLQSSVYLNATTLTEGVERTDSLEGSVSSEWKYKLLDPVADPVGFAVYGEVTLGFEEAELEGKLIVDKRLGPVLLAANLIAEYEWGLESGERELKLEQTAGVAYLVTDGLAVGLEARAQAIIGEGEYEHTTLFAGPVFSYASAKWWVAFSFMPQVAAFKAEEEEPDAVVGTVEPLELHDHERFNARLLVGFHL